MEVDLCLKMRENLLNVDKPKSYSAVDADDDDDEN